MIEMFFTEKRIIKKIIIAIVFIFMFNFTFSYLGNNVVFAVTEGEVMSNEEIEEEGGGKLLLPIHNLILFVSDSVLSLMQQSFLTTEPITIKASSEEMSDATGVGMLIAGIVITALVVVAYVTPIPGDGVAATTAAASYWSWALGVAATTGKVTTLALGAALTVAGPVLVTVGGISTYKSLKGEFNLPNISYTPSVIFSNDVPLFNINFFNPSEDKHDSKKVVLDIHERIKINYEKIISTDIIGYGAGSQLLDWFKEGNTAYLFEKDAIEYLDEKYGYDSPDEVIDTSMYEAIKKSIDSYCSTSSQSGLVGGTLIASSSDAEIVKCWQEGSRAFAAIRVETWEAGVAGEAAAALFTQQYEIYEFATEEDLVDTMFGGAIKEEKVIKTYQSTSKILQKTVASMYNTLRTIAIVSLLSILVYVGIKIVLSSASKDKAKYKQMLIDWLVAFILLFALHYIMAFVIDICESLTDICTENNIDVCLIELPSNTTIYNSETRKYEPLNEEYWYTNIMGVLRFNAGLVKYKGFTVSSVATTIMYLVMVIYLVIFSFQYMRRVLYMAFLTMIAPLVAITYPLDKINDGKAQGFSMWLKEYIFNALLQPIHYIIYIIVMGSVMDIVIDHPVYGLVALGFMVPAEKFIRKMFGFEKASTVGGFGAAAGAAALMSGLQRLRHGARKKKNDDNGAKGTKDNPNGKIRTQSIMPEANGGGGNGILPGRDNGGSGILPGRDNGGSGILPGRDNGGNGILPERDNGGNGILPGKDNGENEILPGGNDGDGNNRLGSEDQGFIEPMPYGENSTITTLQGPQEIEKPSIQPLPHREIERFPDRPWENERENTQKPNLFNRAKGRISEMANGPVGQGFRAVGGHYSRRLENRLRNSHPLRALRRGLTYGAGALTLGTIGLAAGIASGDPNKVLQYTTAGAAVGGHLGKNLGETASNVVGLDGAFNSFQAGALGDKYNEMERAKYKRDFKRNTSNYDAGVRNVTAKGWKDMSKDGGIIDTGLDYGINNIDDLSNIYKAKEQFRAKYNMADEEAQDWAFKAYKLDQNFGDWGKNIKTRENLDKLLIGKGYTDEDARKEITKKMVETMGVYQDVALNKEIKETPADYTRIQSADGDEGVRSSRNVKPSNQIFEEYKNGQSEEESSERIRTDNNDRYEDYYPPYGMPLGYNTTNNASNAEQTAARANAESDAIRRATEEKRNKERLSERLEKEQKAREKEERRRERESRIQRRRQRSVSRPSSISREGVEEGNTAERTIKTVRAKIKPLDLPTNTDQ